MRVKAKVPEDVMGVPLIDKPVGTVIPTEVTVPEPAVPLDAAVILPWAFIVMFALV